MEVLILLLLILIEIVVVLVFLLVGIVGFFNVMFGWLGCIIDWVCLVEKEMNS